MKVFISWSGPRSHAIALALREWLPRVLQGIEPYVSSEDIEKGARWGAEIGQELNTTSFGILCVTRDNIGSTWLNFEAGAISKSVDTSRVSPFLMDLSPADLVGPLSQFQATLPRLDDVARLIGSLNSLSEHPIDDKLLVETVEIWWSRLDEQLQAAINEQVESVPEPQRNPQEMLGELLEIARGLQRRIIRQQMTGPRVNIQEYDSLHEAESLRRARISEELLEFLRVESLLPYSSSMMGDTIGLSLRGPMSEEVKSRLEDFADRHGVTLNVFTPAKPTNESSDNSPN